MNLSDIRSVAAAIAAGSSNAQVVADVASYFAAMPEGSRLVTLGTVSAACGWSVPAVSRAAGVLSALGVQLPLKGSRMATLLEALPGTTAALAKSSGYDPRRVRQVMTELEARGRVERARGPTRAPVWRYTSGRASPPER